ncbi:MAG: hypothetical protein IT480_12790 [Gammaproteobacteria bacterium]|nr:hypothetical protein [Gammaproteobacteria bacterium]
MKTHRICSDGVFLPRTLERPDGSRLLATSDGGWVRQWQHSDGVWRPYPLDRDELYRNQMIDPNDSYWPEDEPEPHYGAGAGWAALAGGAVFAAILIWRLMS